MSSTSNKRHKYTAQFKLRVVQFAEKSSNSKAGREFGVNEKLVRDWRRNVDKLQSMPRKKCADRGKKCYWPALEDEVAKWVTEQRQDGYIEKTFTPAGNMRAASLTTVCEWVKDTHGKTFRQKWWCDPSKKCGISNAMDGTEDDMLWEDGEIARVDDNDEAAVEEPDIYDDRLTAEQHL